MPAMSAINMIRRLKGDAAAAKEILRAIAKAKGNRLKAAEELGIRKTILYRLIAELDLSEQIDALCKEKGFKLRAGRDRGQVDEETLAAIREGRRKVG